MTDAQLKYELKLKSIDFRKECETLITIMDKGDYAKKIHRERAALAKQNKRDQSEFTGREIPNPSVVLPLYYENVRTQVNKEFHWTC